MALAGCSDLLEEGEEPFEVLPGGRVGPCLYAALRVLCASDADLSHWSSITGAHTSCAMMLHRPVML